MPIDVGPRIIELVERLYAPVGMKVTAGTMLFDDLHLDSLRFVELVMDVEYDFSVEVPNERTSEFRAVGDLIDFVKANKWWA